MSISNEFQQRFIELVDELDLNKRTDIAKSLGITYATFIKIYNYGILPSVPILIRIADYFNISIEYLLGNTDNIRFDKAPSRSTFQARLNNLIKEKRISTIYELSQISHIHRNNIAQWIKKDYIPTIDDLLILTNIFDVTIDYILGRTDIQT